MSRASLCLHVLSTRTTQILPRDQQCLNPALLVRSQGSRRRLHSQLIVTSIRQSAPPPPSNEIDHQMKSARMAGIHSQVEKNKIDSIGLQIAMLRSNEEVYVSVYGQEAYGRKIVGLLTKLPGLRTESTPLESDLDSVGMSTPRANIT
jgi:hypothetical protein